MDGIIGAQYQGLIDAAQIADDIDYALRSIKTCGGSWGCTGIHAGQLYRGCAAAGLLLDSDAQTILNSGKFECKTKLLAAKKIAAECLKESRQALKDFGAGGKRQLRLALASDGEMSELAQERRARFIRDLNHDTAAELIAA